MQGHPQIQRKKGDTASQRPNLYTSPGKRGTYGFIKTTISAKQNAAGAQGEYAYAAEPCLRARTAAEAATSGSEVPFVPSSPAKQGGYGVAKTNIGNKAAGTFGEFAYSEQGSTKASAAGALQFETPFVPARAPRKGHNCTMTRFPEYHADPDQIKADARRQARQLEVQALSASSPWHPSSVPKIAATRSIVRMNVK